MIISMIIQMGSEASMRIHTTFNSVNSSDTQNRNFMASSFRALTRCTHANLDYFSVKSLHSTCNFKLIISFNVSNFNINVRNLVYLSVKIR